VAGVVVYGGVVVAVAVSFERKVDVKIVEGQGWVIGSSRGRGATQRNKKE
jgi:hypothetical protein